MDLETQLKQQLADLEAEYRRRAQPIIDQLVKLESLKPPKPIFISQDGASGFRAIVPTSPAHATILEDLARRIDDE